MKSMLSPFVGYCSATCIAATGAELPGVGELVVAAAVGRGVGVAVGIGVDVLVKGVEVGMLPSGFPGIGVAELLTTGTRRVAVGVGCLGVMVGLGVSDGIGVAVRVAVGVGVLSGVEVGARVFVAGGAMTTGISGD